LPTLARLLADLTSQNESKAEAAATALAAAGPAAVPALLSLLVSNVTDERWWAIRTLALVEGAKAEWFLDALLDPQAEVRAAAALAIAGHPDARAVGALIPLLSDEDNVASVMAVNALVEIGAPGVMPIVEAYEQAPARGRIQIVRCLAELRDPRAIHLLMRAQGEASAVVQYWAQEGLERLGLNMVYLRPD